MYGLYIDDMKGTCSPITDTMCVKYKKKIYCCFGLEKSGCYTSGGPDKNRVYGLSNTTTENLRAARSVSIVGSSQSVSSTQSKEFVALKQHTAQLTKKYDYLSAGCTQLSANYEQLRQMVMNMALQSGDTCAPPPFWPYNNQPPPPPPPPAPPLC